MKPDKTIFDLPFLPRPNGSDCVIETYVRERNLIKTEDDLMSFVKKWSAIWALKTLDDRDLTVEEISLIEGTFDPIQLLKCLEPLRQKQDCEHVGKGDRSCCGMHVMLPPAMIQPTMTASHFRVTIDVALIQLFVATYPDDPRIGQLF